MREENKEKGTDNQEKEGWEGSDRERIKRKRAQIQLRKRDKRKREIRGKWERGNQEKIIVGKKTKKKKCGGSNEKKEKVRKR